VAVTAGRQLVIAVKLTTPGYSFPVAIERPLAGYADATAAAGQSYVSGDGASWTDMTALIAGTDVCLKGYGLAAGEPARDPSPAPEPTASPTPAPAPAAPAAPTVSVRDGSASAGRVVRLAFGVQAPGATGTADIRFTLQTRQGKVLRSQTLRGVDAISQHTWRVRAPSHRGAYVVVAVATLDTGQVSKTATATLRVR
jgi:hypothetical protein